jgi:hypothetical protein
VVAETASAQGAAAERVVLCMSKADLRTHDTGSEYSSKSALGLQSTAHANRRPGCTHGCGHWRARRSTGTDLARCSHVPYGLFPAAGGVVACWMGKEQCMWPVENSRAGTGRQQQPQRSNQARSHKNSSAGVSQTDREHRTVPLVSRSARLCVLQPSERARAEICSLGGEAAACALCAALRRLPGKHQLLPHRPSRCAGTSCFVALLASAHWVQR